MWKVEDLRHGGAPFGEHVVKVTMHALHFLTVVQPEIDTILVIV